jgi:hypothetical protein
VTTPDNDIDIAASTNSNPFLSAVDTKNEIALDVCVQTIRNRLYEFGFHGRRAAQKENLTQIHKLNRMNFALKYREFNNWNNTVFTDESTFLTGSPHQKNVW